MSAVGLMLPEQRRHLDSVARFVFQSGDLVTAETPMNCPKVHAAILAAGCSVLTFAAGSGLAVAAPPSQAAGNASAEHARVVEHWSPARRAAAIPRDLVLDARGQGYLRRPDGGLELYGNRLAEVEGTGAAKPNAKPGGGGGGDTAPPTISDMNPAANATIGAAYTFQATVADSSGLRSVSFRIQKGTAAAQSFSASAAGNGLWQASLSGFTDGDWSWSVVAKDKAGNTGTSGAVAFKVNTGSGGGGGGGDIVTNAPWVDGGDVQTAVGRIYFEMPSNARRTRWAGYVCSGTAVQDGTSGRSIILTAAHCVYDDANKAFARKVLFIPNQDATTGSGTDLNCSNDPLGCWTPMFGVVDVNWTTRTFPDNIPWDYAYYVVNDTGAHSGTAAPEALDAAVPELPVKFTAPSVDDGAAGKGTPDFTHALGYSYSDDPNFMYCAEDMTTEGTANWWLPSCGLSGGSSGGPWAQPLSGGTGPIISVNSWGYTTSPGMAGPKLNGTSASCVFDRAKTGTVATPVADGNAGIAVTTCP